MPVFKWLTTICICAGICLIGKTDFSVAYYQNNIVQDLVQPNLSTSLRISWGGGTAKKWQGKIRISNGQFSNPSVLGIGPDSAASLRISRQEIRVRQTSKSSYEGIDIDVEGQPNSNITFEFIEDEATNQKTETYSLAQIIDQDQVASLDSANNRFSVVRLSSDRVQFRTSREHLLFNTDEIFKFDFRINETPGKPFVGDCLIEIAPARSSGIRLYSNTVTLDQRQDPNRFTKYELKVPSREGVYNLRFQLNPNRSHSRYRQRSFEREIQFVVLDPEKVPYQNGEFDKLIAEIQPQSLRSSLTQQQFGHLSRLIGLKTNQTIGRFQINDEQVAVQLPVGGWQAVPVNIQETDRPHLVEIEYESAEPMSLGFSILETDQSGQIPNFGFDSGLYIPDSIIKVKNGAGKQVHRFTFWPDTKNVHLLIANRDSKQTAVYHRIRVFQATEQLLLKKQPGANDYRSVMAFFEQPIFVENFGVENFGDPILGQSIHDWVSFYQSINRLAQHLVDSGCGGAFINVYGEGSALMPIGQRQISPRFDSGVFSSMGHDPIRKDVVELIYRIFERYHLKFVPVLNFDHRFREIEFNNDSIEATRLTNFRGQSVLGDNYPVYNPLNADVQRLVVQIVEEIARRYQDRDSYHGMAIVCRPDSLAVLPGSRIGGYSQADIESFEPSFVGHVEQLLSPDHIERWLRWRAGKMTTFYQQLKTAVCENNQNAKLYLAPVEIFKNEELQSLLSPSLHRPINLADAIMKLGLDLTILHKNEDLVVLQPEELSPIHSLASKRIEIAAQTSVNRERWYRDNQYPAHLFLHRSSWARFENLENSAVFSNQQTPILRLQHLSPAGAWNTERFVRAILESDSRELIDGGLLINTDMDRPLLKLRKLYSRLPNQQFSTISHRTHPNERHPVAARFLNFHGETFLYCVNGSPWNVDVIVNMANAKSSKQWIMLDSRQRPVATGEQDDRTLTISLEPFELYAIKTNATVQGFESFEYQLPESASRELNKTYYELRSHVIASGKANAVEMLEHPSFENASLTKGWNIGAQDQSLFSIETSNPLHGRYSLKIDNQNERSVWIRSQKFVAPVTGRLSVSVWLKTENVNNQPPLRISIEGADSDSSYYRFAEVGSLVQDKRRNQVSSQWKRFVVHFEDLPIVNTSEFRIGFDLMGPGVVWVDQLELYDRWMDEIDLKALTQLFAGVGVLISRPEKLEQCRRILNGYWPQFLREYYNEENVANNASVVPEQPIRSTMRRRFRRLVSPGIFQFR